MPDLRPKPKPEPLPYRARYLAEPDSWTDVPEAVPHCVIKAADGTPAFFVQVALADGALVVEDESRTGDLLVQAVE